MASNEYKDLDWPELLGHYCERTTCELASEVIRQMGPFATSEAAVEKMNQVAEAQNVIRHGRRPFAESLDLFNTWYLRLQKNAILKTLELKDLRHFLIEVAECSSILEEFDSPWIEKVKKNLISADEPLSAIDQLMTPDGEIRSDASETLYKLFQEKSRLKKEIENLLDKLVKTHAMENILQDKYVTTRDGRWVLPVKSGMQHSFEGIIHAASHSKQTVFMEPQEIVPINNRLRELETEVDLEIERLLTQLSDYLFSMQESLYLSRNFLLDIDEIFALAHVSNNINASVCEFSDDQFDTKLLKHPLLTLSQKEVVGNDVLLCDDNRILLLSGPNAGGKTVLLKAIGLASHMARCGLPICAEPNSQIPFYHTIRVAIGDLQSVTEQLSTFAGHLKVLNECLELNGLKNLLLVDEICGATDPEEGAALARSFLHAYRENHIYTIVTSHFSQLKIGWQPHSGVINGSLEYNRETGRPTYQFLLGIPGESLAIQTAERVGVRKDVIENALNFLAPEHRIRIDSQKEIEQTKKQLQQLQLDLQKEKQKAQKVRQDLEKKLEDFERSKQTRIEAEVFKAKKQLQDMVDKSAVDRTFKNFENFVHAQNSMPEIVKKGGKSKVETFKNASEFSKAFPPGSKVFVNSIGRDGVIQSTPNNRGEIDVLSGSMRLSVAYTDLTAPHQFQRPQNNRASDRRNQVTTALDTDREIDLRGLTIEQAQERLEALLDTACLNEEDRVKIIHGHGTEALKRSIRSYLSRSVYVKKWTAGNKYTGGDGVTWVEMEI